MGGAWKVGLFVLVFGGLLFGGYVVLGRSLLKPATDRYYATMSDAGGITAGAKVLMSGVRIGQVSAVELASAGEAKLTLELKKGVQLPAASTILIPSSLIGFGDNPVLILPGPGPQVMATEATMEGRRGSPMDSLMPEAKGTLVELEKTLKSTQALMSEVQSSFSDGKLVGGVTKLMDTSERTVGQFGSLAGRMDKLVIANQAKIGIALDSATLALKDVRQSTQLVAKLLKDGNLTDQAMALLTKLNETSTKATELVTNLNAMVNDPKLRDPLSNTMANVEKMSESGTKMALDGEKIAKNGVVISENTVELTKKANEIADEAKTITKQIQKLLGGSLGGKKIDLQANLDIIGESRPRHYRTDIEGTVNMGGTPIHFGLFDAFETNRITLQAGMPIHGGKGEIRYGVYASKPGIGVEYQIARGLALRSDLFDVNNPRLDIRARYELGNGFYGWLGANSIFKRNSLLLGFGFRK